jgi:hypothetical protein
MNENSVDNYIDIKFRGQFDKNILYQAVALTKQLNPRSQRLRFAIMAILLILAIMILVGGYINDGSLQLIDIGRSLPALVLGVFFFFEHDLSIRSMAAQLWRTEAVRRLLKGKISLEGITYYFGSKRTDYAWEEFTRSYKVDGLVVLVTRKEIMCMFPRRFFEKEEDWESLNQIVNERVG